MSLSRSLLVTEGWMDYQIRERTRGAFINYILIFYIHSADSSWSNHVQESRSSARVFQCLNVMFDLNVKDSVLFRSAVTSMCACASLRVQVFESVGPILTI